MQPATAKTGTYIIVLIAGISSCVSFFVIGSGLALTDPHASNGGGAGFAIVGFFIFAPIVGILGAIVAIVLNLSISRLIPSVAKMRTDPRWTIILASIIIGLIVSGVSLLLLFLLGS